MFKAPPIRKTVSLQVRPPAAPTSCTTTRVDHLDNYSAATWLAQVPLCIDSDAFATWQVRRAGSEQMEEVTIPRDVRAIVVLNLQASPNSSGMPKCSIGMWQIATC